uniref:Uncharacterized protein n=1 Tax=Acrobeloides nanus TaxID=290746 RepID=A0A914C0Y0_9BILA
MWIRYNFVISKYTNDSNNIVTRRPEKVLALKDLYCNASCTRYFACIANGGKYCTYAKGECNCDYPYWKDTFRSCLPPSCREACSYNGDCDYWCRLCQIKISDEEKGVTNDKNCVGLEKGKMIRCGCLPVSCRNKCHEGECSYWCGLCEKE